MYNTLSEREWLEEQKRWRTDPRGVLRWALTLKLRNEKGIPLEWENHRFLLDILTDMYPWQVVMKCSQVGLSTINIFKAHFCAQVLGRGVIYTLPTSDLVSDFAATKVGKLLETNPWIKPTQEDSVGKRVYKEGFVLYRGTFGERQQITITADLIVADEADRSNLQVLEGLESRLDYSEYKGQWWFTNPSRPNWGTDVLWQESDQRKWYIKCPHCSEEQTLDFWQNIDRERREFVCRKCRGILCKDDRRRGRWVATYPGRKWHGYHINQLMAPWKTAVDILDAEKKPKDVFFNFTLGLPVVGQGVSVEPGLIMRARVWPPVVGKQKFLGVDVGGALHCIIGNEHGITKLLYLDGPDKWAELHRLMDRESINLCVIDNAPGDKQVDLQRAFRYRVLRCVYDYDDKRRENWEEDSDEGIINAHRTRMIDSVLEAYAKGGMAVYLNEKDELLNGTGKLGTVENCLTGHWSTLYVPTGEAIKTDRMGNEIRTWENAGPDHFAHANVYYYLAREAGRHLGSSTGSFLAGGFPGRRTRRGDDDDDDDGPRAPSFYG